MVVNFLFILFCFLLDGIIIVLFPNSFLPSQMVFVPCLGLSSLVLTNRHLSKIDSVLLAACFGLFYDFFVARTFLTYTVIFVITIIIARFWSNHMMESLIECLLLAISTIFVKEFSIYLLMYIRNLTQMDVMTWVMNRLFLTLLINGILVVVIVFASRVIQDYILLREKRIRKEESLSWLDLLSKR